MGARPATAPPRAFVPSDLEHLPREVRRQLCHALVVERGARVREVITGADFDDLLVDASPLWRRRLVRVRLLYRGVEAADLASLEATVRAHDELEGLLVEAGAAASRTPLPRVAPIDVIRAPQLIERMNSSALVSWSSGQPAVDRTIFDFARNQLAMRKADSVGLSWLPWLARNKRPPDLAVGAGMPDAIFEEMTFRLLTSFFRFGGRRLGASAPGSEVPDAIVYPPRTSDAYLVDCKASRDAYRMTSAHYRALRDYVRTLRPRERRSGRSLTHVVLVSSRFSGVAGSRHPYYNRARNLAREARVALVYLSADDLVRFALHLEQRESPPAEREEIDWASALNVGLPVITDLLAAAP